MDELDPQIEVEGAKHIFFLQNLPQNKCTFIHIRPPNSSFSFILSLFPRCNNYVFSNVLPIYCKGSRFEFVLNQTF